MRRYRQTLQELLELLSDIETHWKDAHADAVMALVNTIPEKDHYGEGDIIQILDRGFDAGLTAIRLVLDMSKDEFQLALKEQLGSGGAGQKKYLSARQEYATALLALGFGTALRGIVAKPVSWRDILNERLKTGRGSAIKGQTRGRCLEDFAEAIVKRVFSGTGYDKRCRFVGAGGTSTEKTDFAIPSRTDPRVLIEAKAYGATGSKQTDILGDFARIVEQKRHDTHLLLVTDGVTWKARLNDLRKLVEMQNQGLITRIYTRAMAKDLETDLKQLCKEHSL